MFEKEDFEKYMKDSEDYYDNREPMTERKLYQLWKDGAEFGYNKANEWHNPKEKLPTKDCEVLIEYDEHKTHRVVDWNNKSQHFGGFSIDEVTRWKEIE